MLRSAEIGIRALGMHGTISDRRGGAGGSTRQKVFRDKFGVLFVGKFLLGHKCIGVEPFQKIGSIGSHDLRLRIMDMRVDEARHNEVRAVIGEFHIRARFTADSRHSRQGAGYGRFSTRTALLFDIAIGMAVIEALRLVTKRSAHGRG